eukprot:c18647_g1_i1.p1 GENE.c18647_g1_i1~~c18647_g1_i1.p1  ORF type:complete len:738 (-),score=200.72 c18647_g1_i1:144-2357(-)
MTPTSVKQSLTALKFATELSPSSYKAWHAWAFMNYQVVSMIHNDSSRTPSNRRRSVDSPSPWTGDILAYLTPAVQGFIRSISLGGQTSLQDILWLLTLWFTHGDKPEVDRTLKEGIGSIAIETWLQVVPQLIARIEMPNDRIRNSVHDLLSRVAKEHPQALVYSLAVSCKSQSPKRQRAAEQILNRMRTHSGLLVEQALLVSAELIRVAILWHEQWYEGLDEASRLYFGDHNIKAMLEKLEPLHKMMNKGAETMREISFQQAFARELQEAYEWCTKYKQSKRESDLNQAWDIYYRIFRLINKQLPQLTSLELQYCSPRLLNARDLELAVPGTYRAGHPVVRIAMFSPTLSIIASKQRPRKLTCTGSDGQQHSFLLKGHEDLRQDERVMQLFGLVNTLLANSPDTSKYDLSIQRYEVIPLSPNSGLIEWVPHCDTLHALMKEYREARKILLNIEHRLMLQMAPDYDNLMLIQKVEVFEYALESTTGQDLCKVLWLKSKNSEVWLDRRTNFTRSLAVMSMVGYILGLGDRHPSNLMLDRITGKVQHIDFGDCFEVAMHRDKFPEKIPFRLTRMLTNAMEVSGIEGNFRSTCERVMQVLRDNKESAMAMLEAFVHDPLINWRLLHGGASPRLPAAPANGRMSIDEDDAGDSPNHNSMSRGTLERYEPIADSDDEGAGGGDKKEKLNAKAVEIITRVESKLRGTDFGEGVLKVQDQVEKLIEQATSHQNLAQLYVGWCPFW